MNEDKKSFNEKWQDKKYQAKVKLSGYGVFVVIVILILVLGGGSYGSDVDKVEKEDNLLNEPSENKDTKIIFNKPDVNNYSYEIEIITKKNDIEDKFYYSGNVLDAYEELVKKVGNKDYNYRIKDNKYYAYNDDKYILTTEKEVYDILDYSYLNLENINNYLSISKLVDNEYRIYLRDIILDNTSEDYISINMSDNSLNIDYTKLINFLENEEYNSYVVNIEYIK